MIENPEWELQINEVENKFTLTGPTSRFEATGTIVFNTPPAEIPPTPEQQEKKRVEITGRIGVEPQLQETKKGKPMLKLPIAVKTEDPQIMNWKQVYFFNDRAAKLAPTLRKGQLVTVVGYAHEQERTVKGPNGEPMKKVQEVIFGTAISDPAKRNQT